MIALLEKPGNLVGEKKNHVSKRENKETVGHMESD
jgi:hypothetical protein